MPLGLQVSATTSDTSPLQGLLAQARAGVGAWASAGPQQLHFAAARDALAAEGADIATAPWLAQELHAVCVGPSGVAARLTRDAMAATVLAADSVERHGMLTIDADLADFWELLCPAEAELIRSIARDRLDQFRRGALNATGLLAKWANNGHERLVALARTVLRLRTAEPPPAVTAGVVDALCRASYGGRHLSGSTLPSQLFDHGKRPVVEFDQVGLDAEVLASMFRGRALLASVTGTRVIRWQIMTAHRQKAALYSLGADFRRIVVVGGASGLAEQIGEPGHSSTQAVMDILRIEAYGRFALPGGQFGNLIALVEPTLAAPGKPAILEMMIGDPFLRQYVHSLPPGRAGEAHRRNRVLVPLLDRLPDLASGTGGGGRLGPTVRGPAALLHWLVLHDLAQGARALQLHGGVQLNWPRLWHYADLTQATGARIRDMWLHDGDSAPAMLRRVDGDRYALGKAHARAEAFILERNVLADAKSQAARFRGQR